MLMQIPGLGHLLQNGRASRDDAHRYLNTLSMNYSPSQMKPEELEN